MPSADDVARYYAARAPEYDVSAGYVDAEAEELRAPLKAAFRRALKGRDVLEIACGTGYWTAVIARAARSVLATDVSPEMIAIARSRLSSQSNVKCQVADAYSLDNVRGPFTAAFAHWWWSHVPKSRMGDFLTALHRRLQAGAVVLFVDQLPYPGPNRRRERDGNLLEDRALANGRRFEVVKNFPTESEVRESLRGVAEQITYTVDAPRGAWTVTYRVAQPPSSS